MNSQNVLLNTEPIIYSTITLIALFATDAIVTTY